MYVNNDIDYLKFLKKKKVIIFGVGKNGKKVLFKLKNITNIIACCDNDKQKQGSLFMEEYPILSVEELCKINNDDVMIVICSNHEKEIKEQLLEKNIYNFMLASQIDFGGGAEYYDGQYFQWQKNVGRFAGKIQVHMFQPYIHSDETVVEFGCGGGYLLSNIVAKEKVGIEINDAARDVASKNNIKSVKNINDIPDNYADVIISSHALEHVENPLGILKELYEKLKWSGKIVFYVPNESCDKEYRKSDINNHLYTWNCLTIGNLFKAAGYFVHSVEQVQEVWPGNYEKIEQEVSYELFEQLCKMGGKTYPDSSCLIVAYK
ncbi:MAG: class I SAM-dependent methyltransferase [Roseburia sp.]|nr:class I SAM-dependent methyltransferase [Roseburia sp.]MCM1201642.1 class I SAM-dependent methyltransferase [Bacteroides fragilis]